MKKILAVLTVAIISTTAAAAAKPKCQEMMAEQVQARKWRKAQTHVEKGEFPALTSKKREANINITKGNMEAFIIDHVDVPEMEYFAAEGVIVKHLRTWQANQMPFIEVSNLPADGVLRGTIVLPVSGHLGNENARKWAKTDTYTLYWIDGAGKQTALTTNAKSLDLITFHELAIPLKVGETGKVEYHRSGSGGPGGFPGGRILEIRRGP